MAEDKSIQRHKFCWDKASEEDKDELINFLKEEFGIDWAKDAKIAKSDDGVTIHISTDEHSAEIKMDDNKEKATLKIRNGETYNLKVKEEVGELNIYSSRIEHKDKPVKARIFKFLHRFGDAAFDAFVGLVIAGVIGMIIVMQPPPSLYCTPTNLHYSLTTEDNGYIHIWEPCKNKEAPKNGWLFLENPFYKIIINLDHSYYMIFDKKRNKDILVYDDTVKRGMDLLTGCDLGFCDHDADNALQYATTAFHDTDGITYEIVYEDSDRGFVLIDTEGWDTQQKDAGTGYDVEAEIIFGIFANKSYFINAVELTNMQEMGCISPQNPIKDPDEIVQSWVLIDEYEYACMKGGDNANADWEPPIWYNITSITTERKPWHTGSASFSKMHPEHILLGDKFGGGVVFSLPRGIFRFDDSLGIYGDQIPGEFILYVKKPQKAIAFTVNPVNELLFFYDIAEFNAIPGYKDLMARTCERYGLMYPNGTIDAHRWKTKRYAYVITLKDKWCDVNAYQVSEEIWTLADQGIEDFYSYQDRIRKTMEDTTPLSSQ